MDRHGASTRVLLGIILIAAGTLFLLDELNVFGEGTNLIGTYWPVLIIAVGLWMWWTQGFRADLAPVLVVLVGTFLLIDRVTDLSIWRLWPVLIIVAGAWLLYRRTAPVSQRAATESGGTVNISAIAGGGDSRFAAEEFLGGQVTAIFGGGKLDLRDAILPTEGATVDVTVLFGGCRPSGELICVPRPCSADRVMTAKQQCHHLVRCSQLQGPCSLADWR
ncbi:MAG: DUF5668 domain-containing protein [Dehalococcoidia bacterium]